MAVERSHASWIRIVGIALVVGALAGVSVYLPGSLSMSHSKAGLLAGGATLLAVAVQMFLPVSDNRNLRGPAVAVLAFGLVVVGGTIVVHLVAKRDSDTVADPVAASTTPVRDTPSTSPKVSDDPSPSDTADVVPVDPNQVADVVTNPQSSERQNLDSSGIPAIIAQPCWGVTSETYGTQYELLINKWGGPIAPTGTALKYTITMITLKNVPNASKFPIYIEALQPDCTWKDVATLRLGSPVTIDTFVGQEIRAYFRDDIYLDNGQLFMGQGSRSVACIAGVEGGSSGCKISKTEMVAP